MAKGQARANGVIGSMERDREPQWRADRRRIRRADWIIAAVALVFAILAGIASQDRSPNVRPDPSRPSIAR